MAPLVTPFVPGIFQVRVPIPVPLKFLNAYLLRGPDGWTIVDCGVHDQETEAVWRRVAAEVGFGPGDVEAIFVTHQHLDHYGAAGWLQQWLGAPVLMGDREVAQAQWIWDPERGPWVAGEAMAVAQGIPEDVRRRMWHEWSRTSMKLVHPQPQMTPVADGTMLTLGGRRWQAINLMGHSDGLMVLWNEGEQILLMADQLLVKITPVITLWPQCDPDPLGSYLRSLDTVAAIPARLVFPGHRANIADLPTRAQELKMHHDQRLAATLAAVASAGPAGATVWEVALALFGRQTDRYAVRFASGEAAAHVEYLLLREQLRRRVDDDGAARYTLAAHRPIHYNRS